MQTMLANRRELSVGVESKSTPGTAATVLFDGTASRYYIYEAKFQVAGETFERNVQRKTLSRLSDVIGRTTATITFKVEVRRSNSGTTPDKWAELLKGCGCAEDTVTDVSYNPASEPDNYDTLTMWLNIDGVRLGIAGAMGNCVFSGTVGEVMMAEFTFQGVYQGAADQAISDIDTPETGQPPIFHGINFVYNSVSLCLASVSFDLGNDVQLRDCANQNDGVLCAVVVGRRPTLTTDPEQQLVATVSPYGDHIGGTPRAVSFSVGSDIDFAFGRCQITNISDDDRNGIAVAGLTMQVGTATEAGDDEWSIDMA